MIMLRTFALVFFITVLGASLSYNPLKEDEFDFFEIMDGMLRYYNYTEIPAADERIRKNLIDLNNKLNQILFDIRDSKNVSVVSEDLLEYKSVFGESVDTVISFVQNEKLSQEFVRLSQDMDKIFDNIDTKILRAIERGFAHSDELLRLAKEMRDFEQAHKYNEAGAKFAEILNFLFADEGKRLSFLSIKRASSSNIVSNFNKLRKIFTVMKQAEEGGIDFFLGMLRNWGMNETASVAFSSETDIVDTFNSIITVMDDIPLGDVNKDVQDLQNLKENVGKIIDDVIRAINNQSLINELKSASDMIDRIDRDFDLREFIIRIVSNLNVIVKKGIAMSNYLDNNEFSKAGNELGDIIRTVLFPKTKKLKFLN